MKVLRGTKRVCHACAAPFYDLSREPIVCPSCGVHYVPDAPPTVPEARTRAARITDKRARSFKPPDPERDDVAPEVAATEDANEEALSPAPNDDVVLEEELDEAADLSGVVGHRESDDPKER